MILKPARLLLALTALVAVPAFAQNAAVVNGKPIPTARVDAIVKTIVAEGQGQDTAEVREDIKRQLIQREVEMQEALKQGYDKKPEVKAQLETARQAIVVNYLARDCIGKNPVTDADIKAEYDRFVKSQAGEKEYHLRHILLASEDDAKGVIAKLKGGAKFEDLAKAQSKDAGSANTGGDLDWIRGAQLPAEFSASLTKLPKGGVTDAPVKTQDGFHVIRVDDQRPVKLPAFEEVKPQIAESLTRRKLAAFQDEVVKKAKIK